MIDRMHYLAELLGFGAPGLISAAFPAGRLLPGGQDLPVGWGRQ